MLLLGLGAMALAVATMVVRSRPAVHRITLTAGPLGTTRALVARMIVDAVAARGAEAQLVETAQTEEELEQVDSRHGRFRPRLGGVPDQATAARP